MELGELRDAIANGSVDTVLLAGVDMQGRLQGKRMDAHHFIEEVAERHSEACNYLLTVDAEMTTVSGYALTSWEAGYGDMELHPDLASLRPVPWQERTAFCIGDFCAHGGGPIPPSPRQVLKDQLARLAERGWTAQAATELEFIVFEDSYEAAWDDGYRSLTPANRYNVDYSLLGTARVEPLIGAIRRAMSGAGLTVENSKGECNPGQHEINFRYDEALRAADDHVFFKNAAKEIAADHGNSITFMAKYNDLEGSSCHLHLSLVDEDGRPVFAEQPEVFDAFVSGMLATAADLTLLHAPNINSYKRYADGSFAPTAIAWGRDNRTCMLREVGQGVARRIEHRLPGADVNPYIALAAMIAGGLHGLEHELPPVEPTPGNAYTTDNAQVPKTLAEARELFLGSDAARAAFGDEVVEHYAHAAATELSDFNAAVTDWERVRGFERL